MTMLVATLGLLPAALSHDIGSDSQRPFAIVIVGGLISDSAAEHRPAAHVLCLDRQGRRCAPRSRRRRLKSKRVPVNEPIYETYLPILSSPLRAPLGSIAGGIGQRRRLASCKWEHRIAHSPAAP